VIAIFVISKHEMLQSDELKEKYGSLYLDLKFKSKVGVVYFAAFCMRRLLFSLVAVFLVDYPIF